MSSESEYTMHSETLKLALNAAVKELNAIKAHNGKAHPRTDDNNQTKKGN